MMLYFKPIKICIITVGNNSRANNYYAMNIPDVYLCSLFATSTTESDAIGLDLFPLLGCEACSVAAL